MSSVTEEGGQWPRDTTIIGVGTMGLGVAENFAAAGLRVHIADATHELTQKAKQRLMERVSAHIAAGLLSGEVAALAERVVVGADISSAVRGADFVFEAVPENLGLKREVFGLISEAAPCEAIVASNTSSIPIDDLAESVAHPERFLGLHWFNPPEWIPGVEIIPSAVTDPKVVEQVRGFLYSIGKRPALVKSSPGFVANRIQMAMFREALFCVEEGLASPEEVDEVVRSCFGFRLPFFGPFQIADMAGLDVYVSVFETLEEGLGERFRPPAILRDMVRNGRVGTKSGEGFFAYSEEQRSRLLLERDRRYAALTELIGRLPFLEEGV